MPTVSSDAKTITATDPAVQGSGTAAASTDGGTMTRTSGSWISDGFLAGQLVTVSGVAGSWRVVGVTALVLTLRGTPLAAGVRTVTVPGPHGGLTVIHGGGNRALTFTGSVTASSSSLTRSDSLSWAAEGFAVGQTVTVSGETGTRTIVSFGDATCTTPSGETGFADCGKGAILNVTGGSLASGVVTVSVYDAAAPDGVRIGGDTITVCSSSAVDEAGNSVPCGSVLGGPDSPLVIYGDTSQDGLWYSGDPDAVDGRDFGPKPFDPNYLVNDQNDWLFPLANPFEHAGNDVIDASGLFAGMACDATCSNLPSVGVTIYGGAGDDTIIGSQAGDYLAGGSGDDLILGQRGIDQIYGDSGINVDLLTRGLAIVNVNAGSTSAIVDPLLVAGDDTIYGEGTGTVGSAGQSAADGLRRRDLRRLRRGDPAGR